MKKEDLEREAYNFTQDKMAHYSADQNEVIEMLTEFAEKVQEKNTEEVKADCDFVLEGKDVEIKELKQENNRLLDVINNQDVKLADLEQQIEKLKHELNAEQKMRQYWHDEYCKVVDNNNFEITKGVSN